MHDGLGWPGWGGRSGAAALAPALALLLGAGGAAGGDPPAAPRAPTEEAFDRAVQQAGGAQLWGTVLAARGGEVLFVKGYGAADYAERANAPDTLFELASASKQVTATAILRLEQQKKLKTSDTLDRFFRDVPADKRAVTLDHLLHHTSGLAPDLGVPYAWPGSRPEYVRQMLAPPLATEPGKAFAYSNVGYALLAAVVEEVTKRSFEDWARRELFAAAGLEDTGFIGEARLEKSPRVSVRRSDDAQPGWTAASWWYGWGYRGMGGVVTTALDVLKWDRALRGEKLLSAAAKQKLYAPALERYACGWLVETTDRGTTKVHHSGGVRGYAVMLSRWLEEDALVVVLSNGKSDIGAVEKAVAGLLFPPARLTVDLDVGDLPLGEFGQLVREQGGSWAVRREGGEVLLELRVEGRAAAVVHAPATILKKLIADLESALAASTFPEPGAPAAMEAGVYLNLLGRGVKKARLDEGLELVVMPRYHGVDRDGQPVEDPRTVLVVASQQPRGWPVMARMNPGAVRALLAALRKA